MTFSIADIPDLTGKVAIVTGSTAGLGFQSVLALARKGCHVIFTARSAARGQSAVDKIEADISSASCNVEFGIADNEDLASVVAFVDAFLNRKLPLHILKLNAGGALKPYQLFAIRLLPVLKQSAPSRIVIVSSSAHEFTNELDLDVPSEDKYSGLKAYAMSKVANILMEHKLFQEFGSAKVLINSLHPGEVATPTPDTPMVLTQLPAFVSSFLMFLLRSYLYWFGLSPAQGALTQLYLATSPDVEKNEWQGHYFKPTAKLDKSTPLSRDPEQVERLWKWTIDVIERVLATNYGPLKLSTPKRGMNLGH